MNKQTIQDVDAALDRWHKRLTCCVNEMNSLRAKRKRMVGGKLRVPPPPGKKVTFDSVPFNDDPIISA